MRRLRGVIGGIAAGLLLGMLAAPSADASFHLMKVRALFLGPMGTDVAFIQLQMYADGQNLTAGHEVNIYNAGGVPTTTIVLPNVPNGQSQRTILIGDTSSAGVRDLTVPGLRADLAANSAGGAICFDTVDCYSWGNFAAAGSLPSPPGTPGDTLSSTQVRARTITANCPTALDELDDTNNSLTDFANVIGYPVRGNTETPAETLCTPPPVIAMPNTPVTPTKPAKKCKKKKKKGKGAAAAAKCTKKKKKK